MANDISGMNFLYVISSGNQDDVYKIGISHQPQQRLEQIKRDYNVPRAFIVETMDVPSRDEVFAVESALHEQLEPYRSNAYKGREWFKLTEARLNNIIALYQQESDSFRQATAYYGLVTEEQKLRAEAKELELERKFQITFNRRNGRYYDTKPRGVLKRYKDLTRKLEEGVLADRFGVRTYAHPIEDLRKKTVKGFGKIIDSKLKGLWWKMGLAGGTLTFMAGTAVATPDMAFQAATVTTIAGALFSGATTSGRKTIEVNEADEKLKAGINQTHSGLLGQTMVALVDKCDHKSYLVRDYEEPFCKLRKRPALRPRIKAAEVPAIRAVTTYVEDKPIIPLGALVATAIASGVMLLSITPPEEKRQSYLPLPPVTQMVVGQYS